MLASARGRAWRRTTASTLPLVPGRNVGRAFTPAAKALRYRGVSGTMQASSPTKHGARPCQALQDISAAKRQCTPPSAPSGASTSPYRGGFANGFHLKGSPARGCGVERRLRRIQRDGAGAAVAERKCASAHAARCGHRKPDAGCAARRRLRGALPPCGGDILQNLPETCPASVGDDACIVPQTLPYRNPQAAGEIARPTLWPGTGGGR